jgi:two-component system cell cycle sensor histidine kinase PleC
MAGRTEQAVKHALAKGFATASFDDETALAVLRGFDSLRVAVTVFDSRERLIYANAHYNYLFPSLPDRSALIGKPYEELVRLEVVGGETVGVRDVVAYVASRRTQFRDGEYRPRDIQLSDGRVVEIKARRTPAGGWIVLWTDATHARHLLGRLQSAIELSADAFAFYDRNDRLVMCSPGFAQLHAFGNSSDLVGRTAREIVEEAASRGVFKFEGDLRDWLERRSEAHNSPVGAMTLVTTAGVAYLVRERASQDGRVTVFTDVTDNRRVETALAEQTRALERTKRALDETKSEAKKQATYLADLTKKLDQAEADADTTKKTLLRTMSHELKTPLNAIIGFSDLLRTMAHKFTPEQIEEYASLINQGGTNLLKLLNQILDLTKIAAGRFELQRIAVDASAALLNAKSVHEEKAETKSIKIKTEDCPAGILVDADENAFNGILLHLVENAMSFTQQGGEVRLVVSAKDGWARIVVSDNGPGVATEDLSRILRPFEQGGRGTADHSAGAGLGLTLVKGFVELHGGQLSIDSSPGAGFSAAVDLPLHRAP